MRNVYALLAATLLATTALTGCSHKTNGGTGNDMSPGGGPNDDLGVVVPSSDGGCTTSGGSCATGADCCSGSCDPTLHVCTISQCAGDGAACGRATDCCNLSCVSGVCATAACLSDGKACTPGGDACCSGQCDNGTCKPLNPSCKTAGNACGGNDECCGKSCIKGVCAAPSQISYCTQVGDICFRDNDCCTGSCTIAAGASAGTCAALPTSCAVDGTVCNGCTGCCSSYCQPFGTSGARICQPTSGCRVLGDLCLHDGDCCGGDAKSGLPGAGLVRCMPVPGNPHIGTCGMPNPNNCPPNDPNCKNSCQPEGDVCHFLGNGGCSSNSFPNNCCGAPGNKGACMLDKLGVPRCYGIAACVEGGKACASSADCCDGVPCVPDGSGHLVCGASSCAPSGGVCTTTGDCCTGYACVVPPGATSGTCVNPTPPAPPNDMGMSMPPPPPNCGLSGQACTKAGDCCGGAACVDAAGLACGANESCVCISPIT